MDDSMDQVVDEAPGAEPRGLERLVGRGPVTSLEDFIAAISQILPLFDDLPNTVFFIKDVEARYVAANLTLAQRCGFKSVSQLLGKSSAEVFPTQFVHSYVEQDRRVLQQGIAIQDQLELHLYGSREPGWCLTSKRPLRDKAGGIIGMVGVSNDLLATHRTHPAFERIAVVGEYVRDHFSETVAVTKLAKIANLSVAQLERYCKRIFHLTPRQMIAKMRLAHAHRLLTTNMPITAIALECGYTDHSAFSRQFKAIAGVTPQDYRKSRT